MRMEKARFSTPQNREQGYDKAHEVAIVFCFSCHVMSVKQVW